MMEWTDDDGVIEILIPDVMCLDLGEVPIHVWEELSLNYSPSFSLMPLDVPFHNDNRILCIIRCNNVQYE